MIHTPENLAKFQLFDTNELWRLERYHLPSLLKNVSFITGSPEGKSLIAAYEMKVKEICISEMQRERAIKLMGDDLQLFTPDFEKETLGIVEQFQNDLFRFISTMLDRLAEYYSLQGRTPLEIIEELERMGILISPSEDFQELNNPTAAKDLKELIMLSQGLRLSCYFAHNQQLITLGDIKDRGGVITGLYFRAMPFFEAMRKFYALAVAGNDPTVALQQGRFFCNSSYVRCAIAHRFGYVIAANVISNNETIKTFEYLELSGDIKRFLGLYQLALECFREAIPLHKGNLLVVARLHLKIGDVLKEMAKIQDDDEGASASYLRAKNLLNGVLEEKESLLASLRDKIRLGETSASVSQLPSSSDDATDKVNRRQIEELKREIPLFQKMLEEAYRSLGYLQLHRQNFVKAKGYLKLSELLVNHRTRTLSTDLRYKVKTDLSLAENLKLEAKIAYEENNERQRAMELMGKVGKVLRVIYQRADHPSLLIHASEALNYDPKPQLEKRKKFLQQFQRIFGKFHPIVVTAYGKQASTLSTLGLYKEAFDIQTVQSACAEDVYGKIHPVVADIHYEMGNTSTANGQFLNAITLHTLGLETRRLLFGDVHPDMAMSYNNLGLTKIEDGSNEKGVSDIRNALDIMQRVFGNNHSAVANIRSNLIDALTKAEHFEEALGHAQQLLECWETNHADRRNSEWIRYANNVANFLNHLGRCQESLDLLKKVLDLRESIGEQHPPFAQSYNYIETALSRLGLFGEALPCLEDEVRLRRQFFGKKDLKVNSSEKEHSILSGIIRAMGRLSNKQYSKMFKELELLALNNGAFTPDLICFLLYGAVLAGAPPKKMKKFLEEIENWRANLKIPAIERAKIAVALVHYHMKQKSFNEAIKYAALVSAKEPGMMFTYRLIEVVGMEDDSVVEGAQVSFQALGKACIKRIFHEARAAKQQVPESAPSSSSRSTATKLKRAGKPPRRRR